MERRKVFLPALVLRMIGFVPWIILALGIALGFFSHAEQQDAERLATDGQRVMAEVVEKETVWRSRDKSDDYYFELRFQHADGDMIQRRIEVGQSLYDSVEVGGQIPIHYLPSDPSLIETSEGENATSSTVLALLSGAFVIGAIAYLFYAIKRSASLFRAAVSGEVREARVKGIRDTGVTVNKVRQFALQWVDAVGQTGESLGHPGDRLDTWPVGSIILVYADPKTGATWWEEDIAPAR